MSESIEPKADSLQEPSNACGPILPQALAVRDTIERGQPTIEISAHEDYATRSFLNFVSEAPAEQLVAYFRT
eukprot:6099200-Pyramimonas_sp.AAC.1